MKERYLFLLIMVFVLSTCVVAAAEEVTPSELLDRYAKNLKAIEMHHIKSEGTSEFTDSLEPEKNKLTRTEYESIQNGQLRELSTKTYIITMNDEGLIISSKDSKFDSVIWDGQEWSQVNIFFPLTPSAFFSKTNKQKAISTSSMEYDGACLDGIFWGDIEPIVLVQPELDKLPFRLSD